MNRSWFPFIISVSLIVGIGIGIRLVDDSPAIPSEEGNNSQIYELGRVEEVMRFIEAHYVDSVDMEVLKNAAIEGILSKLDPHSIYITKDRFYSVQDEMNGHYTGIGIISRIIDSCVYVHNVRPDSPADSAGIRTGDQLLGVNGQSWVASQTYDSLDNWLSGQGGKIIQLKLARHFDTLYKDLIRRDIKVSAISASIALNDSIGYIGIDRFGEKTYKEFMQAFEKLNNEGVYELVIDVRGNSGGYLDEAAKIISQFFVEKDLPIAWSDGLKAKKQTYSTTGKPFYHIKDVIIIVDENTASASEILAGSLQDLSRAVIIGRRTFGKGLVQEQYELSDGSAFRLTVARYYLPSGRSVQRNYTDLYAYNNDWRNRRQNGELLYSDSIPMPDTTTYFTRANKRIHGQRGVVPDIFMGKDEAVLNGNWKWLKYAMDDYVLSHLYDLKDSFELDNQFKLLDDEAWDGIRSYVMTGLIGQYPDMYTYILRMDSMHQNIVRDALEQSFAYCLLNEDEYSRFKVQKDSLIQKGLEILEENKSQQIIFNRHD